MSSSSSTSFDYVATHIIPLPNNPSYFLAVLLLPTALLIPPSVLSRWTLCALFLPLIYALQLHACFQMGCADVVMVDLALWSFHLLAFRDPRQDFKRVGLKKYSPPVTQDSKKFKRATRVETWQQEYPADLAPRISWVLSLLLAFRFTNWKIGNATHDRKQPYRGISRLEYLKKASIQILQSLVLMDLAATYIQTDPYFFKNISITTPFSPSDSSTPTLLAILRRLPPWVVRMSALGAQICSAVNIMFILPALIATAINVLPDHWSPHNWPLMFGPFSAIIDNGLRGLWGSFWHQTTRHMASVPGRALNELAGIPTSSTTGYISLVTSAFLFTGILHAGLVPLQPLKTDFSTNELRLYMASFFWVQVIGVYIELLGTRIFRPVSMKLPSILRDAMVLIWTAGWLGFTLPLLAVPFRGLGYWDAYPFPVSPTQGIWGQGWFPWSGREIPEF
ncbi:hypothetical protein MMC31_000246 [Peltigera leucophlebia]|nr:hypothetical protein [Peltigera leucophlebia]